LPIDEYQKLAADIEVIIHNGALVHWMYPYEKLRRPNVIGTKELVKFALTSRVKPVHYVSTTSVFDSDQYVKMSDIYEDSDLPFHDIKGGYPQSKWTAEKIIMRSRDLLGLPANIYRPGYICGNSKTGVWTPDDFLCRVIKGCIQLECYPDMADMKLDMSPVDFVSRAIVTLFQKCLNQNYHLVNPVEFYFNTLLQTGVRLGYTMEKISYLKWKTKLFENLTTKTGEQNALYPMLNHFTDDYETRMRQQRPWYDNTNALRDLEDTHVSCPPVQELIGTYYGFLCECGFLEMPHEPSKFAMQKGFFQKTQQKQKLEARKSPTEKRDMDYVHLLRNNRIDSSDQLSDYHLSLN
jgi:L-aminoadipate-semialdehyde dehydrogenase